MLPNRKYSSITLPFEVLSGVHPEENIAYGLCQKHERLWKVATTLTPLSYSN